MKRKLHFMTLFQPFNERVKEKEREGGKKVETEIK
jgi:hypothetical protein